MNYITIKDHCTDGLVAVETFDADTEGVGGFAVSVSDLWRWLWRCRPCTVHLRGRIYSLQTPARCTGRSIVTVYRGTQGWPAR
jgi:hypothetical protein